MEKDNLSVEKWWSSHAQTYGVRYGTGIYNDVEVDVGSKDFFERLDREFFDWNSNLHSQRPFDRLFPFDEFRGRKVLEIGCGMGTMAMLWARAGAKFTGVDLSPFSIEMSKRRFDLFNLEGTLQIADSRNLPFPDESFDFVYSWGVLHHSPRIEHSLAEAARVLKPGGRIGVMLYNRKSLFYLYRILYREGFLHYENRFLGALELASRYTDSTEEEGNPHTWPVTPQEFHELLSPHCHDLESRIFGLDIRPLLERIFPFIHQFIPATFIKPWARRFGWSIWVTGIRS